MQQTFAVDSPTAGSGASHPTPTAARYVVEHEPEQEKGQRVKARPWNIRDTHGGWICSSHTTQALAAQRALFLNRSR